MADLDTYREMLRGHASQFRDLTEQALRQHDRRSFAHSAALAQLAGAYAWLNHPGVFAAPELDRMVADIGGRLPAATARPSIERVDVVHVVSQIYATGGPTQAIACWLDEDSERRHAVVLTQQGASPIPAKITDRVAASRLVDLGAGSGDLLRRGARLRALMDRADLVVLHTHPHDVIAMLALGGRPRPGVITVNHADHVFWLGTAVPGVVFHMRNSGRDLAHARRGIGPDHSVVMARPLNIHERRVSRDSAKAQLDLPTDAFLVVTCADGAKYRQAVQPAFLDLVVPFFADRAGTSLLAAGPDPEGIWAEAEAATHGRVRALGRLNDVSVLQQAADVYLDSFPFSSLTSMLEAGSYGTPLVTFRGHPSDCGVLGADTPGVDDHVRTPATPAALITELDQLREDQTLRAELGAATREAIARTHVGAGWQESVRNLYARALAVPDRADCGTPATYGEGRLDLLVTGVQAQTPFHQGLAGATRFALPFVPPLARSRRWVDQARSGRVLSPALLLSPNVGAAVTKARRRLGIQGRSNR